MHQPSPLPKGLSAAPFTVHEARAAGLTRGRLRAADLTSTGRLLYQRSDWEFDLPGVARALSAATPGAWISHLTAAALLGLWLPPWLQDSRELHLSKPKALPPARRSGVVGHTVLAFPDETMCWEGIHMSTPARTWLDLARLLPLEHLVAVGDQLVRPPRPASSCGRKPGPASRSCGWSLPGTQRSRASSRRVTAVELFRCGSDSAPETFLRLALTDAGLPEPGLQVRIDPGRSPTRRPPTSGTGPRRIAIQYDGGHHLSTRTAVPRQPRGMQPSMLPAGGTSSSTPTTLPGTSAAPLAQIRGGAAPGLNARCPITYGPQTRCLGDHR